MKIVFIARLFSIPGRKAGRYDTKTKKYTFLNVFYTLNIGKIFFFATIEPLKTIS